MDLCGVIADNDHASIASESHCAYQNGFLHICTPPTSERVLDTVSLIDDIRHKASKNGVKLYAIGALTQNLNGKTLANIASLKRKTIAVSNGRCGFVSDDVLLRALEYAGTFDIKVFFIQMSQACPKWRGTRRLCGKLSRLGRHSVDSRDGCPCQTATHCGRNRRVGTF